MRAISCDRVRLPLDAHALGREQRLRTAASARSPARSGCARSRRRPARSSSTRIGKRPCSSGIRSRRLGHVERAGGDEQHVVGLAPGRTWSSPSSPRRSAADRAARPRARRRAPPAARARAGDLVDLVEEHDAGVLGAAHRLGGDLVHVDQLAGLFAGRAARAPAGPSPCAACAAAPPRRRTSTAACPCRSRSRPCPAPRRPRTRRAAARRRRPRPRDRRACRRAASRAASRASAPSRRRRVGIAAGSWIGRRRPAASTGGRGSSRSSSRSSAASRARARTLACSSSWTSLTEISTRSRTIESTSRPT